jgi:small Trp-rich protein
MPFVWIGALLIVLKWLQVGPFGQWSWWWILLPLALAFAWFELIEPLFGFDRRKGVEDNYAKLRKQRIDAQFPGSGNAAAGRRSGSQR